MIVDDGVRTAYGARAAEYIAAVGRIEHAAPIDREEVLAWAAGLVGPVLDVGCGPGQWTDLLRTAGIDVSGVDPVPEFVAAAKRAYPDASFRAGRAERLDHASGTLGGVLAWFSLIHTTPDALQAPLAEFARAVAPGGGLALGFFAGDDGQPFDHAITTAYTWSEAGLSERVMRAGFRVVSVRSRTDPGARPVGTLLAVRDRLGGPATRPGIVPR